ncbi:hypothetical protein NQ315_010451 [Exocentrus adspersus]|uniref:Cubilin n=1 Tax=Exocentrus adspersus TaxID=1586481 RepID=A0AAV8WBF5_9CUCU|nr:hypothetical protein NQ315_010451 [Exocentrus adspersus]
MLIFIIFLSSVICSVSNAALLRQQTPRLIVEDGHLIIIAASNKNIIFRTSSSTGVSINDIDILSTLLKAHNATKLLENYQRSFGSYVDRIDSLEQRVFADVPIRWGNNSDSSLMLLSIRRLNRRFRVLLKKVVDLQFALTQNECSDNPCKNGGTCIDLYKDYICQCTDEWEGTNCAEDVNECAKFAGTDLGCQNGATCINKPGTYQCLCSTGYVGIHCTRRTADCSTGGQELCGHGICIHQNNQIGYKCICDQGWTTDGTNPACTVDVNECNLNHPACSKSPSVSCVNVPGSFFCGPCPTGYTGNGYYCVDINECEINNGGCSLNPMVTCTNTQGSRICGICPPGYEGNGVACSFKGICNVNNGGCYFGAQCRQNPSISSTYIECICPAGYTGNGLGQYGCIPFNPCASNPCVNGVCHMTNTTGYICSCKERYTGTNCDILKDPCSPNPCLNGGTCQNLMGVSFRCACQNGFTGTLCESEAQSCGGKLTESSGVLKYPPTDYSTYGQRLSCAWVIETNITKVINITFNKFDIEQSTDCRNAWLQIHDGRNSAAHPLGRFCGELLPLGGQIISTHNTIYLWFRLYGRSAKASFELSWKSVDPGCGGIIQTKSHGSIESPGSPGNYPPNRDCYWLIAAPFGKRLQFHFYSLNIGNNADCSQDFIDFSATRGATRNLFLKICNSTLTTPFYSPTNVVDIHFHSDSKNSYPGFQLTYSVVEGIPGCGGIYTAEKGTIQSTKPENGGKFICEYKIQNGDHSRLNIVFLNLNLQQSSGCELDYIEAKGPNTDSPLVGRYCGTTLPTPYLSVSHITIISSMSSNSIGWKIQYKKTCGMKFYNKTGSFNIPTYSSPECIYQIEQPAGYAIELTIKSSLPSFHPVSCSISYLEIRDGDHENATLIKKICDSTTEIITSTHNHLWIRYYRRPYLADLTFHVSYTSTDIGKSCGGILREKLGNIASPTHPDGYYPPFTEMYVAPPKFVIQLTWLTFSLEQSSECLYDSVQVFDNNTDLGMGGLIGKYCGFTKPPIVLSSSNIMTIVFVTDITKNMDGFLATYLLVPESNVCGGHYYTSSGIIKSPGYSDNYPSNRDCSWVITVPPGQQVMLNITDFELEPQATCRYDWLEIRNGGTSTSPLIGKYCGTTIPKQIASHTNQLFISFKSDLSRSYRGFKIIWSSTATGCGGTLTSPTGSIISPQYPEAISDTTDCIWKIRVSAGSRIQVIFSDIDIGMANGYNCDSNYFPVYIQLFDGLTVTSKSLGKFCNKPDTLITSSGNHMLVKFRSDTAIEGRGFQLHYSSICNNTLTGFRGVIESPNFPENYPQDLNCWWDIIVSNKNKINITFSHFEMENSLVLVNKSCILDYVEIKYLETKQDDYEEADSVFVKQGKYCGTNNPGQITINSDHAQIHFVSNTLLAGSGFRLEWQLYGCGGRLTHSSGIIQSPNYPKPYPPSVKCQWQIEVDFGYSIEIRFLEIDIERDACHYDWIQIYNGPTNSSNVIAKLCHQIKPTVISSTGNQMFVEFQSDYSYQGKGFIANYTTVPTKCGGKFTAPEGTIFSPNYPKNYDKNDTCFWFIEVEESHSIELEFQDVDLPANCSVNYIKVYDGPTEAYPKLIKICDRTMPNKTINSTFNEMYIEFRSEASYTTKGFMVKYRKSCGSRINTEGSGTIQVTRAEFGDYPTCSWTIVSTDSSRHVILTITRIQMHSYYCDGEDPIKIYGGETTESPLIKGYCGIKVPPPIISDGSALTISLESSMDFFATYSVLDSHCGGTFNAARGFFASPGYPKKYPSDMQCEWVLNVAPGNHIYLSFIEFDILESEKCNTDFLEIRKDNVSGPLLGIYCGTNKPLNLTHEGSLWMMYKASKLDADAIVTSKGFYGEFELNTHNELSGSHGIVASPMYPLSYYEYSTFSWRITVSPRKRILLTFKEFYVESDSNDNSCYFTTFEVYDGVDDTAPQLKSTCGIIIPDPITSSTNIIFLKVEYSSFRMGTKFLLEWLEISNVLQLSTMRPSTDKDCGSSEVIDMSTMQRSYSITSPGYPTGYKPNLHCEWIFSTIPMNHLELYFFDVNLYNFIVYSNKLVCNSDYISLYQRHSDDNDWELVNKVCSRGDYNDTSIHFTNLLKVEFVTNRYMNGSGFKASVVQSKRQNNDSNSYIACGGSMVGPTGYIYSTNVTTYGSNCQWNVTVRSGKTIKVTFEELNIPHDSSKGCNNYLMLRNGKYPDSPLLGNGKYCGTSIPQPLNTTGNHLFVKYNGPPIFKGYRIKYQEISAECGGEVILSYLDNSTEINSPNYPNIPFPHSECSWIIRGPPGESLRIDFEERFDLTYTKECDVEYVEVRDGGTQLSPIIGRYCDNAPRAQFSTDSIMFVKFFTNTDDPRNGFKAKILLAYCGGTIRGLEGEIKNPSPQSKDQKRNCTWHITGPIDHYLNIYFIELNLQTGPWLYTESSILEKNKITIMEKDELSNNFTTVGVFTGNSLPSLLSTSSNEAIVYYVGTKCGGTLNIESGEIASPGYPVMNHLNRFCQWKIEVPEGRRITFELVDFDLDDTTSHNQGLALYDGHSPYKLQLAYLKPGAEKQNFETSSNKMIIFFWSNHQSYHRGFKAKFSANKPTICSSDFNGVLGILTQPTVRNSSYWCHWKHDSGNVFLNNTLALTINLNANSTRRSNFVTCRFTAWAITVTNQDKNNTLANLCTHTVKNYIVRSPFPITQVDAIAKNQMNFTVSYNTYNCGGIINNQQGFISSPTFPNKPSESFECAWLIKVDKDQTINLTMLSIDLGSDCDKSSIAIYNGGLPSHPRIGKYCKTDKPDVIISQGDSLWIEYQFKVGATGSGFKLQYEAKSEGCGGIFHDKSRIIQTPNYSEDYPNNAECLWELRSDPGYSIHLKFMERFHIEDSDKCVNDYLEVWDWQHDKWVSIAKLCGRNIPSNVKSIGDKMKILFRSNGKTTASGFKAMWEWICGGTFEASKIPRSIISPGYPLLYSPSLNCVYNITTATDVLNLKFDDFDLENGTVRPTDCIYDNVTISGKYFAAYSPIKKVYCGSTKPPTLRLKGNVVITFKTDKWVTHKGFKFTYSDESCGGDINQTTIIEVPSFDYGRGAYQYFYPRIKCTWKITAPPKQIVIIRVLYLTSQSFCLVQYGTVQVFNGLQEKSEKRLASLCGNITENEPIHSDSDTMLVKLDTSPTTYGGFKAQVYFSYGPTAGCGGDVNLTETKYIAAPDLEDLDCTWKITAPRDYQIEIHFTELNIPGVCTKNTTSEYFCTCSYIEVRDGGGPLSELIEKLCSTSNAIPDYRKFTTSWNTAKCGSSILNATKEINVLTSPNYPNHYPPGIKCSWAISTQNRQDRIELHFTDFSLTGNKSGFIRYNRCDDDRLEIFEDPNKQLALGPQILFNSQRKTISLSYNNIQAQHTFCGTEDFPFDYYSTGKSLTLTLRSFLTSQPGKGFKLEYRIAGCNRNYTSPQGRLFNSNDKSDCFITITVPQNRTISLYFQKLFIYYSMNCTAASFEVRDGEPNGAVLLRTCGLRVPSPVFSYTNKLYIHVYYKRNSYTQSYDIGYTSTDAGRGCGGELYNYRGWVSSPLYPNEFRNNTVCRWAIRVPVGLSAALKFTNFDIQGSCDLTYVSVTVFTEDTPTTHIFCKNDQPAILKSNSKIDIEYSSSVHNGGSGWLAVFQGIEDDTLGVL